KSNLLDRIEKEHTLSNFLIRNRKKNVFSKEFLNKRIVTTITVNPSKEELDVYKEIRNYLAKIYNNSISSGNAGLGFVITTLQKLLTSSKYAFLKSLERRLAQIDRLKNIDFELNNFKNEDPEYLELELENELIDSELSEPFNEELAFKDSQILDLVNQEKILKEFYKKLKSIPYDSKSDKLFELIDKILEKKSNDKVLIFTQFVDTLLFLKDKLVERNKNIFVDVFYGGLDKSKKDEVVKRFRSSDKSSILISTEIGGEGRNFQFCRILINYDLPWNPMKLEQRIGRLDRIGQESKEIYIYNLFLEGTIETDIVFALNKRINLFEESIGLLEPIIGNIEKDIKNLIFTDEKEKRRKLNEFNRNLDETLKKAKEIELQLDDLLIDKKSFQINGLITSMGVCEDVKLSHNELFLLINYFFDLSNNSYGILNVTKKGLKSIESQLDSIVEISLENRFSEGSSYNLNDKYVGTFDLELARDREDIDFFALGHPLINDILKYWKSRSFSGYFSILTINKQNLSDSLIKSIEKFSELYLFIFKIKFQGYIIEEQISAIITDKEGNDFKDLTNFVLNIENYDKIFNFNKSIQQEFELSSGFLNNLIQKAKKSVKTNITLWKIEIKTLNNKIYNLELTKKEKIYNFNRKSLQMKINSLKKKLETKNNQKPTEKQKENILKISDEAKRKERLEKFEKLNEQINILNKDIQKLEKKVDDLSFNHEDLKNELKKRNLNKYYTDLISFALIQFD
ncbi:MAG TPA: helicase-related protein, partial [Candidatus Lokiarchaeia archaeon]